MTTILEAMAETERIAKETGKLYYLYKNPGFGNFKWGISTQYWNDWLFRAYPGGRKILSSNGNRLVQDALNPPNKAVCADGPGGSLAQD